MSLCSVLTPSILSLVYVVVKQLIANQQVVGPILSRSDSGFNPLMFGKDTKAREGMVRAAILWISSTVTKLYPLLPTRVSWARKKIDDYEDPYNDVNVKESDIEEKKPSPSSLILDVVCVSIAGVGGSGEGVGGGGGSEVMESRVLGRVNGFQNQGFRGNKVGVIGGIGVELGNQFGNLSEIEDEGGNDGVMGFVIQGQGGVGGGGGGGNVNRVGGNGVGNNASVVSSINAKGVEGVGGGGVVGSDATILFVSDLH
ncbi:hypothetical protein JHK85_029309 [Glycine max]|nr:hypothetical protein JHK85_029309 [Glycine max]